MAVGYIRIIYADHANTEFISIGQASFSSLAKLQSEWRALESVDDSDFIAEQLNHAFVLVDEKMVTAACLEGCFGLASDELISRARKMTSCRGANNAHE